MSDEDLVTTISGYGVELWRATPDAEEWTGRCPFGDHPDVVDLHAYRREAASAGDDRWHPPPHVLTAPAWRPAFNVRPDRGTWHCFGCGHGGGRDEFVRLIEEKR